jgi:hypothetical protein
VVNEDNYDVTADGDEEDDEEWNNVQNWENEDDEAEDTKDESTAYLDFLNEEVREMTFLTYCVANRFKGSKVQSFARRR